MNINVNCYSIKFLCWTWLSIGLVCDLRHLEWAWFLQCCLRLALVHYLWFWYILTSSCVREVLCFQVLIRFGELVWRNTDDQSLSWHDSGFCLVSLRLLLRRLFFLSFDLWKVKWWRLGNIDCFILALLTWLLGFGQVELEALVLLLGLAHELLVERLLSL